MAQPFRGGCWHGAAGSAEMHGGGIAPVRTWVSRDVVRMTLDCMSICGACNDNARPVRIST